MNQAAVTALSAPPLPSAQRCRTSGRCSTPALAPPGRPLPTIELYGAELIAVDCADGHPRHQPIRQPLGHVMPTAAQRSAHATINLAATLHVGLLKRLHCLVQGLPEPRRPAALPAICLPQLPALPLRCAGQYATKSVTASSHAPPVVGRLGKKGQSLGLDRSMQERCPGQAPHAALAAALAPHWRAGESSQTLNCSSTTRLGQCSGAAAHYLSAVRWRRCIQRPRTPPLRRRLLKLQRAASGAMR